VHVLTEHPQHGSATGNVGHEADRVVLYMREGCHVCARVKRYLSEHGIPFALREVDTDPLTPHELWSLFNRKADRLRVPFTVLNDGEDVVLGYDPLRLEGVFLRGDHGGFQASTRITEPRSYDDLAGPGLDPSRWTGAQAAHVGSGRLVLALEPTAEVWPEIVSTERFATPPATTMIFTGSVMLSEPGEHGAGALLGVRDTAGGITFGFHLSNSVLSAVHERVLLPGIVLPEETFGHRTLLDVALEPHRPCELTLRYRQDSGALEWLVDGRAVYWASSPRPVEGVSLLYGLRGYGEGATVAAPHPDDVVRADFGPWMIRMSENPAER
jgi:glutaredoxin